MLLMVGIASGFRVRYEVMRCITPVRFSTPSRISIRPTANSMARPMRGGMTTLNRMMAAPTQKIVMVWPMPHRSPMTPACRMLRWRLTMVETAMT